MEISNTRFGSLLFEKQDIITIPRGLMGFPLSRRFILFPHSNDEKSPLFWMQSLDEAPVAFPVVNPFDFFPKYEPVLDEKVIQSLGIAKVEDVEVFTVVTIPENHPEATRTNLAGPLIINVQRRCGEQIWLRDQPVRQSLIVSKKVGMHD